MRRAVLITGVSGGIGQAAAALFTNMGWHVFGVDIQIPSRPPDTMHFIKGDIQNPEAWDEIGRHIEGRGASLDALVNNAALQIVKPLLETSLGEWDAVMSTNVRAAYLGTRATHRFLERSRGAIVNIASVHALSTSVGMAAYAASKGALWALTRAAALEFAPSIRVNAVLPGAVDTAMLHAGLARRHDPERSAAEKVLDMGRKHVAGRVGKPEEIARAIYFLADNEQSSFMTGQGIIVDGGATARLSTE